MGTVLQVQSMCGRGDRSTANMAPSFPGVLNGEISQYSLENVKQKFQVLLFYPGDWSPQSQAFLSSFSSLTGGLERSDCLVYGVSSEPVTSHQEWLSSATINPPFPLISDTAGLLATKYGIISPQEEGEEGELEELEVEPCRCVVITDNQAVMLELVNTSLTEEELVTYTQDRLDMLVQKRRMAVDRARNRERVEIVDQSLQLQRKLGDISSASLSLVSRSGRDRYRSESRSRSMGRSLSRSNINRVRLPSQQSKDPLFEHHLKRTVDRLVKGFF